MGVGKTNNFKSDSIEYSTPSKLIQPLLREFSITTDVCASHANHKCAVYYTKYKDAFTKKWEGNCWMNPPFSRDLSKWVKKAWLDSRLYGGTKVCLIPVRSNTKWWAQVCGDAEIRFINGEVNFNDQQRGLWMPLCIMIFGEQAKQGSFSVIDYR